MKTIYLFGLIGIIPAGNIINAQTYHINTDKSIIRWTGSKVTGSHHGTVFFKKGYLKNDRGKLSGKLETDMTSLVCEDITDKKTNDMLVGHLRSDDFFSVETYPVSIFEIISAKKKPAQTKSENYFITGNLTIKGITNKIEFPATVNFDGGALSAKASFTIDRTKWNIRYGSGSFFDNLGDKMISNDILFHIELAGEQKL